MTLMLSAELQSVFLYIHFVVFAARIARVPMGLCPSLNFQRDIASQAPYKIYLTGVKGDRLDARDQISLI